MSHSVVVLPGDGIGPEIMAPALDLIRDLSDVELVESDFGGASIERHGVPLTDDTYAAIRSSDAILFGAVGGPDWDYDETLEEKPGAAFLRLRRELGLYANLRPVRIFDALRGLSPIRPDVLEGTDLLIVRELTGGIYFGARGRRPDGMSAFDTSEYSVNEIERVARVAFRNARRHVTNVDKANVLQTSLLWREVVDRVHHEEFPDVELSHLYVDNAAMQLVSRPSTFDVVLTENMFGDILSDEAAVLTGSIGLMPSASLGDSTPGLFEPIHGSAPDIAGKDIANPLAMFLTVAAMFRFGLDLPDEAAALEFAIGAALDAGLRTIDLGGSDTTTSSGDAVRRQLAAHSGLSR